MWVLLICGFPGLPFSFSWILEWIIEYPKLEGDLQGSLSPTLGSIQNYSKFKLYAWEHCPNTSGTLTAWPLSWRACSVPTTSILVQPDPAWCCSVPFAQVLLLSPDKRSVRWEIRCILPPTGKVTWDFHWAETFIGCLLINSHKTSNNFYNQGLPWFLVPSCHSQRWSKSQ